MAMIEWVDQRLMNWARWRCRGYGGAMGYASVNLGAVRTSGYAEAAVPMNACEAADTHEQVQKLAPELRRTVELYYLDTTSRVKLAAKLHCAYATVDARLSRAHRILSAAFTERSQALQQAREQAEWATKAAR